MLGKRLVEVLAESHSIKDRFLCVKGDAKGEILFWDADNGDRLTFQKTGNRASLAFNYGGAFSNKWILIRG